MIRCGFRWLVLLAAFSGAAAGQETSGAVEAGLKDPEPMPTIAPEPSPPAPALKAVGGFQWKSAIRESFMWLGIQHGYAMTQPKTRLALNGPFFKDYFRSVGTLNGWSDGGRFFTNYIAHPMQGSFMGYIQVQNDPKGRRERFGRSGDYWRSRMKALAWSAAWSTQFEIGPISQASIGNVGEKGKQTWIDIVVTPMAGLGMMVGEDFLDRFVIRPLENRWRSRWVKFVLRTFLNPTRASANMFRMQPPWHRDQGLR